MFQVLKRRCRNIQHVAGFWEAHGWMIVSRCPELLPRRFELELNAIDAPASTRTALSAPERSYPNLTSTNTSPPCYGDTRRDALGQQLRHGQNMSLYTAYP